MEYVKHLKKDTILANAILDPTIVLKKQKNIPLRLMQSIMSQQLNTKVAAIIYNRFIELYEHKEPLLEQVIQTPNEILRAIGLSNAKVAYVKNVALFCMQHNIIDKKLAILSNDEIIQLLTQIKGVGKWTVEMLLMFAIAREDVFAVDDLGIQQAMIKLYQLESCTKKELREQMLAISNYWKPYRTYACLHLWKWKNQ